jgi:DNA polymerase-3 subunit epsilon
MSAQQKTDRRLWWLLGVAALLSVVWLLVTLGLVGSTLEPTERTTVWGLLGDRLALISLTWGAGMAAIAWGLKRWFDHWVTPSVQLA